MTPVNVSNTSSSSETNLDTISSEEDRIAVEIIGTIHNILNDILWEYQAGNYTGAATLIDIAYLDNFEYMEAPLAEKSTRILEETKQLLVQDLSIAVNENVPLEQVQQIINKINSNLLQAEQLFITNTMEEQQVVDRTSNDEANIASTPTNSVPLDDIENDAQEETEVNCYQRGISDGKDHPFNQGTYDDCGDDYYRGFIEGCMSVKDNDREICQSATDA